MVIGAIGYLAVDSCNLVLQSRELKHTQKLIDGLKACGIEELCNIKLNRAEVITTPVLIRFF